MKFAVKKTEFELKTLGVPEEHRNEPYLVFSIEGSKLREGHKDSRRIRKALRPVADHLLEMATAHPKSVPLNQWAEFFRYAAQKAGEATVLKTLIRFYIPMAQFELEPRDTGAPVYFFWGTANTNHPGRHATITHKDYKTVLPALMSKDILRHIAKLHKAYDDEQEALAAAKVKAPLNRPATGPRKPQFNGAESLAAVPWGLPPTTSE